MVSKKATKKKTVKKTTVKVKAKKVKASATKKKTKKTTEKTTSKKATKAVKKAVKVAKVSKVAKTVKEGVAPKASSKKASPASKKSVDVKSKVPTTAEIKKEVIVEEVPKINENLKLKEMLTFLQQMDFFKSQNDECLEKGCDNPVTTLGHCRFHYIKNWSKVKLKLSILNEGKLQNFIHEFVSKYPFSYIEVILNDLSDQSSFFKVLKELNIIDGSFEESISDELFSDDQDIVYEAKKTSQSYIGTRDEE